MKWSMTLLILIILLLFAGNVLAMSSTNYRLDWFTPLTGSGGGPAISTNYSANFTVGQTVIGASASDHYRSGLGYWYVFPSSIMSTIHIYLPLVWRN